MLNNRQVLAIIIIIIFCFSPILPQDANNEVTSLYKKAGNQWELLNQKTITLHLSGQYDSAYVYGLKALKVAEESVGSNHPAVATSLEQLGLQYFTQIKYSKAERYFKQALTIRVFALKVAEADSLNYFIKECRKSLSWILFYLGKNYYMQKLYAEAEPLLERMVEVRQKLNSTNRQFAAGMEYLALVYEAQGKHEKAGPLYERSLVILEKYYGKNHSSVLKCLENLAIVYRKSGRHTEADELDQRVDRIKSNE